MSSSASIQENNFNDTSNDADDISNNKRSTAKTYDCVQECESRIQKTSQKFKFQLCPLEFSQYKQLKYEIYQNYTAKVLNILDVISIIIAMYRRYGSIISNFINFTALFNI
ncbi:hypothetical protein BpHYR1_029098 [Brachionus plicatilis]|uniref:Uncharacterized protein n=1 Tax=Brachionus plicatilis TaxID=10195 RepID=A0A3M7Q426_BRAPC|nr:hypothetical protein BpHYR1_029098 [Brachionus plicatilis]